MSVRRRQRFLGGMRLDVPILRSIESAVSADFDELLKGWVTGENKEYVLRGFEINMAGAIGSSASGLQMLVASGTIFHGTSRQSGTFYTVPSSSAPEILNPTINAKVRGAFTPGAVNYVGIEYERFADDATADTVYFWTPTNKNEFQSNVPLAQILRYTIVITTSVWAANVTPIAKVAVSISGNVDEITDQRPMLFRLGTAGRSNPNPSYDYGWTNHSEGRVESASTSNTPSINPFRGGDKQIYSLKEWMDAVMTSFKELKGTTFWYSPNIGGSLVKLRQDLGNTVITGRGNISHSQTSPGRINWSEPFYISLVGSRLSFQVLANPSSSHVSLSDNQAAYINLVRGVEIVPNIIFTNLSATVSSVGGVSWTGPLQAGDWLKLATDDDTKYVKIQSVDSLSQVTLSEVYPYASTGLSGAKTEYAFGVYEAVASPSTNRHIRVVSKQNVPFTEDTYWFLLRSDNGGSTPRVYVRFVGSELEQGEEVEISDGMPLDVLAALGLSSDSDRGALRILQNVDGPSKRIIITPIDTVVYDGTTWGNEISGLRMKFDGIQIDMETGQYYGYGDGTLTGSGPLIGTAFTPVAFTSPNLFRWYSINLVANTLNADGTMSVQPLILAGTSGSSSSTAVKAPFSGKKIGQVLVQAPGSGSTINNIAQANVVQLSSGAGGGGSSSPKLVSEAIFSWNLALTSINFNTHIYIEQPRLDYADNRINASSSPIVLPTTNHVAFIDRLNASPGGPDLTVSVDLITNVKDGQIIIARRIGNEVIIGSGSTRLRDGQSSNLYAQSSLQTMTYIGAPHTASSVPAYSSNIRGTSLQSLTERAISLTDAAGDPQEDRSAYLRSNEPVTWTGTELQFTSDIVLDVINTKTGGIKTATIEASNSPIALANGESAWFRIVRSTANEPSITVLKTGSDPIPAQSQLQKDIIVLATRRDALGAGYLHLPLHKQVIEPGQSIRLGASGGEGEGNELLERTREHLEDSSFEFVTPVIFKVDKEDKTDTGLTTGDYSIIDKTYELDSGEKFVSVTLLDPEFLTEEREIDRVELLAFWEPDAIDTGATYRVTRDGVNYQTVEMERVGSTDTYRGLIFFTEETDQPVILNNSGTLSSEVLNATTNQEISQSFTLVGPTHVIENLDQVTINKTGSPVGDVWFEIARNNAGVPGEIIGTSPVINIANLSAGANAIDIALGAILKAETYHLIVKTSSQYKAVFSAGVTEISIDTRTGGVALDAQVYNGTAWSSLTSEALSYRLEGRPQILKVEVESSAAARKLSGLSLFYGYTGPVVTGVKNLEVFRFSGDLDTTEFVITKFKPNPDLLKVYDVNTGAVYRYGAFSLSGNKVVFSAGQFLFPGEQIVLIFDQNLGGAFDNSDDNANLLAENRLGSEDATLDRSAAGEGILLRSSNGKLCEVYLEWNGTTHDIKIAEKP